VCRTRGELRLLVSVIALVYYLETGRHPSYLLLRLLQVQDLVPFLSKKKSMKSSSVSSPRSPSTTASNCRTFNCQSIDNWTTVHVLVSPHKRSGIIHDRLFLIQSFEKSFSFIVSLIELDNFTQDMVHFELRILYGLFSNY